MKIPVYIETGSKRTFASAAEWPGWARSGRDESAALRALLEYAARYAGAVRSARLGFEAPAGVSTFTVLERLRGNYDTDFGTPGRIPAGDAKAVDETELRRLQSILEACWRYFDETTRAAPGKTLRTGPRGGGRNRQKIMEHVLGGAHMYLVRLGDKLQLQDGDSTVSQLEKCRRAMLKGLAASAHGELPERGPRGALHWPARYFVRREAWHVLDHAWEIQDRLS